MLHGVVIEHHILCVRSSIDRHCDCFHVLAIVNNAALNMNVQIPVPCVQFFWVYIQAWNAGSHGNYMFNLLRNYCAVLHSGRAVQPFTALCSSAQGTSASIALSALVIFFC